MAGHAHCKASSGRYLGRSSLAGNDDSLLFLSTWTVVQSDKARPMAHAPSTNPVPPASQGLRTPSPPPRKLSESNLCVGRSESLLLGDSLVVKPPHALLGAELLSPCCLF